MPAGENICKRMAFRYHNGRFQCGQVNVLFAFTDIGPGDGATMVIPGSHKSNLIHPAFLAPEKSAEWTEAGGGSAEGTPGAVEVHLKAGDAILFVDSTCHGSARRVNPGERRIAVYRYGSAWNRTRWGYHASPETARPAQSIRPKNRAPAGIRAPAGHGIALVVPGKTIPRLVGFRFHRPGRFLDFLVLGRTQLERRGGGVLHQVLDRGGARNGEDDGRALQQPGQGELG